MNKSKKILLGCLSSIIVLIVGAYFGINYFWSQISLTDCEQTDTTYQIGEYEIIKYSCLGPVGPTYYPLDLYKNGEKIANNGFQKDSCTIKFNPKNELYLYLNICDNLIKEIRPDKKLLLSIKNIDSIQIFSKKTGGIKKLNEQQKNKLVIDWNKSKISDYRDEVYDSIFYPDYSYKIYVYQNKSITEFITGHHLISNKSKWTYKMSKKNNIEYFNKIWNE